MSAAEFERGQMHEKVREHDRRLDAINGSIDRAEEAISYGWNRLDEPMRLLLIVQRLADLAKALC